MAAKARRKWALVVGALVLAVVLVLAILVSGPRRYAFIDRFGGKRDVQEEIEIQDVAEAIRRKLKNLRCYVFKEPAEKVAAAMTGELTQDGWSIVGKDEFEIDFQKDGQLAVFSYEKNIEPGATCMAIIGPRPNWLLDQWEALKDRLGIE